ncbi:uncharacterized protein N7500_010045 [Penicillium coprophilum]|uniref:uncharacterized protein n=1 Tax=Penicillium coprophilum TaxID=36646 RepID=UPI00239605B2|nr:uncharacterized protein N7500_010045 [Penicillium coprophilum]KAJ5154606.1 hypothetical protein N7500_010045 [Penicillium coprophilum]
MDRENSPEDHSLPLSSIDDDTSMTDPDSTISETETPIDLPNMPRMIERRPRNVRSNTSVVYETFASERTNGSSRATPQSSPPPLSTKMIVELSLLDRYIPFSKRVERLFYDSWLDRTKVSHVEEIILFDIKTVPSLPDGHMQATFKTAGRDFELLTLLGDLPLCFYGARRACYLGDRGHPLGLCRSVECAICAVFREQYVTREAGEYSQQVMIMLLELPDDALTDRSSSQADAFAKNHHIRSSQHAMIFCACPDIAQSDTQTMSPESDAPPPYTASASISTVVVPIGLIMYTRAGWHPS